MVLPLQGIKIVDLSEEIAGPYCSMLLGDFGADVIKVEPVNGDWARSLGVEIKGESALFLALNRNKRSIAIDVETPKGKQVIHDLVRDADIFIESYKPGQADKFGLGYKELSGINPALLYCSISTFGSEGPYKDRSASELEVQAMASYPWYLGETGGEPVRLGMDAAEISAGQCALIGILTAVYHRMKTGTGQKIETSLFDALIRYGSVNHAVHYDPDSWGGVGSAPFAGSETGYQTKDRPMIFGLALSQNAEQAWVEFCKGVGIAELLEDPFFRKYGMRMVGTGRDAQDWKPVIERAFEDKSADELNAIIEKAGGQAGIFKTYEEIFSEPQVKAVEMIREIEHPTAGNIKLTGIPYKLGDTPGDIRTPPPLLGQHTDEVLKEAGYSESDIAQMRQEKIIA